MNNSEQCNQCGYQYEKGTPGTHSCSDVLKQKIDDLTMTLQEIINIGKVGLKK